MVQSKFFIQFYFNKFNFLGYFFRHVTYVGHSAGAHLVACMIRRLAQEPEIKYLRKVKHIFLLCGLFDLTDVPKTLFNKKLKLTFKSAAAVSPLLFDYSDWKKLDVKIYVYAVENDSPTFIRQNKQLFLILKNLYNLKCSYKLMKGFDHFNIVEEIVNPLHGLTIDILKTIY